MKTEINVNQTPVAVHTSSEARIETDYTTKQNLPGTAIQHAEKANTAQNDSHRAVSQELAGTSAATASLNQTQNQSKKSTEKAASADEVKEAVAKVKDSLDSLQRAFDFSVDEDSGHTVVKVMDRSTKEVLRQIPSEEFLAIARNIEKTKGQLFEGEA